MAVYQTNTLAYRPCVGVMLLNRTGEVFVGQRLDTNTTAWQMPQGGIDPDEEPLAAALRELTEETGIPADKVRLLGQSSDWLTYDLPVELVGSLWRGRYRGQRQLWFAFAFTGTDADINIQTPTPEFSAWQWAPLASVPSLIVSFKRTLYQEVVRQFTPLATTWMQEEGH